MRIGVSLQLSILAMSSHLHLLWKPQQPNALSNVVIERRHVHAALSKALLSLFTAARHSDRAHSAKSQPTLGTARFPHAGLWNDTGV